MARADGYGDALLRAMLLVALAASCIWVLAPFLALMAWAVILAIVLAPMCRQIEARLGGRRGLMLAVLGALLLAAVVVPVAQLGAAASDGIAWLRGVDPATIVVPPAPEWLGRVPVAGAWLAAKWDWVRGDLTAALGSVLPLARDAGVWLLKVGALAGFALLELVLALALALVMLHKQERVRAYVRGIAERVAGDEGEVLVDLVVRTVRGVFLGIVGTALLQGLLVALGLWAGGVPGALVLGFVAFVFGVAQLPTLLVWAPAAAWLYHDGAALAALALALWGFLVVNTVDNVLKPMIISSGARLPLLLIFVGVIGGMLQFGFLGLFIGPVLLGVAHTLFAKWIDSKAR
jgi:predicted PurR-regulated permease PerM